MVGAEARQRGFAGGPGNTTNAVVPATSSAAMLPSTAANGSMPWAVAVDATQPVKDCMAAMPRNMAMVSTAMARTTVNQLSAGRIPSGGMVEQAAPEADMDPIVEFNFHKIDYAQIQRAVEAISRVVGEENAEEEIVVISKKGQVIRITSAEIPCLSRATQGVRIMKMREGDSIASMVAL